MFSSGKRGPDMTVMVCIDQAGAGWSAHGQGNVLAAGSFETEHELRGTWESPVFLQVDLLPVPLAAGTTGSRRVR